MKERISYIPISLPKVFLLNSLEWCIITMRHCSVKNYYCKNKTIQTSSILVLRFEVSLSYSDWHKRPFSSKTSKIKEWHLREDENNLCSWMISITFSGIILFHEIQVKSVRKFGSLLSSLRWTQEITSIKISSLERHQFCKIQFYLSEQLPFFIDVF